MAPLGHKCVDDYLHKEQLFSGTVNWAEVLNSAFSMPLSLPA